jgi:hypothetical protein
MSKTKQKKAVEKKSDSKPQIFFCGPGIINPSGIQRQTIVRFF